MHLFLCSILNNREWVISNIIPHLRKNNHLMCISGDVSNSEFFFKTK